jgi:hypothetical protein
MSRIRSRLACTPGNDVNILIFQKVSGFFVPHCGEHPSADCAPALRLTQATFPERVGERHAIAALISQRPVMTEDTTA